MINPFQFGGPIDEDAFCNRRSEIRELNRIIENGVKVFIFSERLLGKTSLIKLVLKKLPRRKYKTIYIDLLPTDDELSFMKVTAKAITDALDTPLEKTIRIAQEFFSGLKPYATVDDEGKPVIKFEVATSHIEGPDLDKALNAIEHVSKIARKRVVVVFDEFQQITEYDSDLTERRLRTIVQHHRNVPYIFLGSRKHTIQRMFLDRSRPLYRMAKRFPLLPIAETDWLPFIRERFENARKEISDVNILELCRLTQNHPFYTQHLCHEIWELCERGTSVTGTLIDDAVELLLQRENIGYFSRWEVLTKNQQRFLRGLASETDLTKPYDAAFLRRYNLGSASSVQRVVETLFKKDIVDRENGTFIILDRFFRLWIQKMQIV
jgi:AAA+ ATPase superfamily predicted ATPase